MPSRAGSEPIDDDEIVFRLIPKSQDWYEAETNDISPKAFRPHRKIDTTGLSVRRAKYCTAEQAAQKGRPGKWYYVASMSVGELRKAGIEIVPRPEKNDAGHAELPGLRTDNRKETDETQLRLADKLCQSVVGPFKAPDPNATKR